MSGLAGWQARARDWLRAHAQPRDGVAGDGGTASGGLAGGGAAGGGLGSVAVFDNLTFEQEQDQLAGGGRLAAGQAGRRLRGHHLAAGARRRGPARRL